MGKFNAIFGAQEAALPPAAPDLPTVDDPNVQQKAADEKKRALARKGFASTNNTRGLGDVTLDDTKLKRPTLLG